MEILFTMGMWKSPVQLSKSCSIFWFPWWSENKIINLDFSAVVFCIEINTPEERRDFLFLSAALTGHHWSYSAWPDLLMTFYNTITAVFLSPPSKKWNRKFCEFGLFLDFLSFISVKCFYKVILAFGIGYLLKYMKLLNYFTK